MVMGGMGVLGGMGGMEELDGLEVRMVGLMNGILNRLRFLFVWGGLIGILKGNVKVDGGFMYAAFVRTFLFVIRYVTFEYLWRCTGYGGGGVLGGIEG